MPPLRPAVPLVRRRPLAPGRRLLRLALACLVSGGLLGCRPQAGLPLVLSIAVGVDQDQTINPELQEEFRERLQLLESSFQRTDPRVQFRFSLYPEDGLVAIMRRRQRAGLEPDLLFVTSQTAQRLLAAGVTVPYPLSAQLLRRFDPSILQMSRLQDGSLSALPALQQLQISCYDRRRLPRPPRTLEELLKISAAGVPVGLALGNSNLFWTLGSLGTLPAVERLLRGDPAGPAERQAIGAWLAWLVYAGNQQQLAFYGHQEVAERELVAGRLAWIPCRSTALPRLQRLMGGRLGVAALPDGPGGQASPVNQIRVLALGATSTRRARQAAQAFSAFSVNPIIQRAITIGSHTVLPVNRHVSIPASSSQSLAALVRSRQQGVRSDRLHLFLNVHDRRSRELEELLVGLVFGEVSQEEASGRMIRILRSQS